METIQGQQVYKLTRARGIVEGAQYHNANNKK